MPLPAGCSAVGEPEYNPQHRPYVIPAGSSSLTRGVASATSAIALQHEISQKARSLAMLVTHFDRDLLTMIGRPVKLLSCAQRQFENAVR
jgi:hypothetical protein